MGTLHRVRVRRVYDDALPQDGTRVRVDRLWPRGLWAASCSLCRARSSTAAAASSVAISISTAHRRTCPVRRPAGTATVSASWPSISTRSPRAVPATRAASAGTRPSRDSRAPPASLRSQHGTGRATCVRELTVMRTGVPYVPHAQVPGQSTRAGRLAGSPNTGPARRAVFEAVAALGADEGPRCSLSAEVRVALADWAPMTVLGLLGDESGAASGLLLRGPGTGGSRRDEESVGDTAVRPLPAGRGAPRSANPARPSRRRSDAGHLALVVGAAGAPDALRGPSGPSGPRRTATAALPRSPGVRRLAGGSTSWREFE